MNAPASRWRSLRGSSAVVGAAVLGLALVPAARSLLSRADPYAPFALLSLGLGAAALRGLSLRSSPPLARRIQRGERSLRRLAARHGLVLSLLLFLLPVWAAWDMRPPSAVSAYSSLFGRIPWSDAAGYHSGALGLLAGRTLDGFNERRPANAALLAVRLGLGGRHVGRATVAQAVLLGLAAWLAARAVGARFGAPSGMVCLSVLLALGRPYVATTLSEPLGLTLGCLAFALLLSGAARRDPRSMAGGLFALALALGARAGALLALPLLAAAGILASRRRAAALGPLLGASVLGALLPVLLLRLYGSPEARPFSNSASIALSLASGEGDWKTVLENRGPQLAGLSESEAARVLYREAWDHARRHPARLLSTLGRRLASYLLEVPGQLTSTLAPPEASLPAALLLCVAAGAGLLRVLAAPAANHGWLWAAAGAGILLSAPFVHGVGGMRVFAATDPFVAGLLALGVAPRGPDPGVRARRESRLRPLDGRTLLLVTALTLAAIAGPALARRESRPPTPGPGEAIVQGPPIAVVVDPSLASPCARVATLTRRAFREGLLLGSMEEADRLARRRPPFAFLVAYDPVEGRDRHFVGPVSLACADATYLRVRTRPLEEGSALEEVVP